ncbi:MAG: hypothetical protein H8K09_00660 [Nitrospira sp.]|nr:hypothetical protein [Nitrospira sp.]ULA67387.1 MAG: conserved exported protein of unknown function [Nitrospira sp.]
MSRRYVSLTLLLMAMLAMPLSGCNVARLTINTPLTPNSVAFITEGKTTLTDVVDKLGAPDSITDTERGTVVTYRFLNAKYSRVNFGWLVKPWSPVDPDLVFSRSGMGTDAFELLCDTNWVVTHQAFVRHRPEPLFTPYPF